MGDMLRYRCPKCSFSFRFLEGVGRLYTFDYEKEVEKMKNGERGKILQKFFEEYPNGIVDLQDAIMQCPRCKNYSTNEILTMYILKPKYVPDFEMICKFAFGDIRECNNYINFVKYYPHKCSNCGDQLKILDKDSPMYCPKCGSKLEKEDIGFWD